MISRLMLAVANPAATAAMPDDFAFDGGGRKPGCDGSDAHRRRQGERPMAAQNRHRYSRGE